MQSRIVTRVPYAIWGILWRMTVWGVGTATVLGLFYGCAVAFPVGGSYGVVFSAALGFGFGLLSGVAMSIVALFGILRTHGRHAGSNNILGFVPVAVILAIEVILLSARIAQDWQFFSYGGSVPDFLSNEPSHLLQNRWELLTLFVPGIIGVVPAWFAGREVAGWAIAELSDARL